MLSLLRILIVALGVALVAVQAQAQALPGTASGSSAPASQAAPALPDPLTPEAVEAMVARMSDDQVRAMLLQRLDAVAAASTAPAQPDTFTNDLANMWQAFSSSPLTAFQRLPLLVSGELKAIGGFFSFYGFGGVLLMILLMAITLGVAYGAELLVSKGFRKIQKPDAVADPGSESTLLETVSFLVRRLIRDLIGLAAFYIVARLVGRLILSPDQIRFVAPFLGYLIWMPRLAAAGSRFVLAPNRPDKRLLTVTDEWAKYLHRHLVGLVLLGGFTIFIIQFNAMFGVNSGETRIGFWLDSMIYIYLIIIAMTAKEALVGMMLGRADAPTRYEIVAARAYPWFIVVVAVVMWVIVNTLIGLNEITLLLGGAHYKTMFWLMIAPLIDTLIRGLTRHLVPPMIGEGPVAEAAHEATKRSYIRIGRVLAVVAIAWIIKGIWNISLTGADGDGNFGADLIEFVMTCAVGYIMFEVASLWVNRRLAREQTTLANPQEAESGGEGGGAGGSRLTTVLPLVLAAIQVAIVVVFALLAIGSLGIDTTPLLASAGILGLAIGFGAQKLVADVVGGIFFLVDDAFRVGEYVDVGGTTGTVEKISIRSMQLRHHRGPVHTIPYGEIAKLTNYSRDWVIMKLKFTVPFETDPNKVKKIFKKIGAEMMADELYKDDFLEPFKSQGVFDFDDVGMIIRGKFMAKPGTQFTIRKEIYNRVKNAFKENGIEFARREVRVAIPGLHDDDLSDEDRAAIAAAAGAAVQQQENPPG
ncbi:MAG: mechanosensitive ion channel protein MscS [Rhodobacteraceae bacterium]|nr:mechanosensitive ion channel protein MscS [Paracoccaceae bacterium]